MYAVVYLEGHVPPPTHTVKHGISNLYILLKSALKKCPFQRPKFQKTSGWGMPPAPP